MEDRTNASGRKTAMIKGLRGRRVMAKTMKPGTKEPSARRVALYKNIH